MKNETKYDVVRKFVREYAIGMGIYKEIVIHNLTWNDAEQEKNNMNLNHLDDCTEYFYIENSK